MRFKNGRTSLEDREVGEGRPTTVVQRCSAIREAQVILKTLRAIHCFLFDMNLLNNFKIFCFRFAEFDAEFIFALGIRFAVYGEIAIVLLHVVTKARVTQYGTTPFGIMTQEGSCFRLLRSHHITAFSLNATKSVSEFFNRTSNIKEKKQKN